MNRRRESGAVSLFLVIFAMLLITIVTLSFLRIMIADQQQASVNDLSKSAYDSSLAGVEDAKRALIYYRTVCSTPDVSACAALKNTINSTTCNQGLRDVIDVSNNKEVLVQQSSSSSDASLDQAYTCVKMQLETDDYLGKLEANSTKVVSLKPTGTFNQILIQWFMRDDLAAATTSVNLQSAVPVAEAGGTNQSIWPLLAQSSWPANRPSVIRAQVMQYGSSFTLGGFDNSSSGTSNANTIFLYPVGTTGTASTAQDTWNMIDRDVRLTPVGTPLGTRCSGNLSGGGYACSALINLPDPIGGGSDKTAYLRISSLYKTTHYRVSLVGTQFDGVQPIVDSTGRANTQFRRVQSRVDMVDTNFPFPEAALDVTGNLCKNFTVTDTTNTIPADQSTCN